MTSIKETIVKNTLWLSSAQLINSVITYLLVVFIARNLGDVSFGEYSFLFSFTVLTFIFSDLGLNILLMKEVSRDNSRLNHYFNSIFTLKIILSLLSFIFTLIISFFFYSLTLNLLLTMIISFLMIITDFFYYTFNTLNRTNISSFSIIIERIAAISLIFYGLYIRSDLTLVLIMLIISYSIKLLFLSYNLRGLVKIKFLINYYEWKIMIKESVPFFLTSVFLFIYFKIDTVILHFMTTDQYVGWYTAAYKFLDALILIPQLLIIAIFPSMSKLYIEDKTVLKDLFNRTLRYLIILGTPISIGLFILSKRLIMFIFGNEFIKSTPILQVLVFTIPFLFINYLIGNLLMSIDKQKYFTITTGLCALINIILNLILIPYYSYLGAAIATVITEIINLGMLFYYSKKFILTVNILSKSTLKSMISGIIMGIIIYNIQFLHIIFIVSIGIITYFTSLFILGIEKEDKELIKLVIKKFI